MIESTYNESHVGHHHSVTVVTRRTRSTLTELFQVYLENGEWFMDYTRCEVRTRYRCDHKISMKFVSSKDRG